MRVEIILYSILSHVSNNKVVNNIVAKNEVFFKIFISFRNHCTD